MDYVRRKPVEEIIPEFAAGARFIDRPVAGCNNPAVESFSFVFAVPAIRLVAKMNIAAVVKILVFMAFLFNIFIFDILCFLFFVHLIRLIRKNNVTGFSG